MSYSTIDPHHDPYRSPYRSPRWSSRRSRQQAQRRRSQIVSEIKTEIVQFGVAIVEGDVSLRGAERGVHYTVGLTRHEGHPEIVIVEECCECARDLLTAVADVVRGGTNLGHGWGVTIDEVDYTLVDVEAPQVLLTAQEIYAGPGEIVPALELIPVSP